MSVLKQCVNCGKMKEVSRFSAFKLYWLGPITTEVSRDHASPMSHN